MTKSSSTVTLAFPPWSSSTPSTPASPWQTKTASGERLPSCAQSLSYIWNTLLTVSYDSVPVHNALLWPETNSAFRNSSHKKHYSIWKIGSHLRCGHWLCLFADLRGLDVWKQAIWCGLFVFISVKRVESHQNQVIQTHAVVAALRKSLSPIRAMTQSSDAHRDTAGSATDSWFDV